MGPRELSVSVSLWGWFLPKLTFYSLFGTILYLKNCSVNFFFFSFFLFVCDYGSCGKRKRQMLLQSEPTFFHFKAVLLYFHIVPAKRCFSLSLSLSLTRTWHKHICTARQCVLLHLCRHARSEFTNSDDDVLLFIFFWGPRNVGKQDVTNITFWKGSRHVRYSFLFFIFFRIFLFY